MKNWHLDIDFEGIGWLVFDRHDTAVNALNRQSLEELGAIITQCETHVAEGKLKGLAILSGKDKGFIAGADINEFDHYHDAVKLREALDHANDIFHKLDRLAVPTGVGIDGFCLGGGLELALSCDHRIAVEGDQTRIGFPEVKIGIYPGFGGSVRAVQAAGHIAGMQAMLSGRFYSAKQARNLGLIHKLVPSKGHLRWAVRKLLLSSEKSQGRTAKITRLTNILLEKITPLRSFVAQKMRKQVQEKARIEHYPAPYALIDLWEKTAHLSLKERFKAESNDFIPLMLGPTATALRRVFHLSESLKKQGANSDYTPQRVHVIGAGVMGGDIAAYCVACGLEVTLQDQTIDMIKPALDRAEKYFKRKFKIPSESAAAQARLRPDPSGQGISRADIIIEAIIEDLDIKQKLFKDIEKQANPQAILASNTSSLEIEKIAAAMKKPQRLIGIHFFNPVAQMPLVEVIYTSHHDKKNFAIIENSCQFVTLIKKFPIQVKSSPGFLVNRVLAPYLVQAIAKLDQGTSAEDLDAAAVAFGMPMGPIELADTVGLDICMKVAELLGHHIPQSSQILTLVADKKLGRKTNQGFYQWKDHKAVKAISDQNEKDSAAQMALAQELLKPLVDEVQLCVDEEIIPNSDIADAGIIFGTGFAPFLGGPLHARQLGKI